MLILLVFPLVTPTVIPGNSTDIQMNPSELDRMTFTAEGYNDFSQGDFSDVNFSNITLYLSLNEIQATIDGTLLIDFYNDVGAPISRIPFHLYTSGMQYVDHPERGIYIQNVTAIGSTPAVESFQTLSDQQLMWVNLASDIQPDEYASLNITFQTIMPDGQDRSGYFGTGTGQTRIFTSTASYPIPCVYDEFDGWNIDPYLDFGDPFYFEMAFYDLYIEVPEEMVVAATGEIDTITTVDGRSTYHYDIPLPVREVTFSASRYYQVETTIYNGVNISAYFLPVTADLYETDALEMAIQSLELFNTTFGIYPYSTLNIVEQHAYYAGMEYPCQVYVTHVVGQQILDGSRAEEWFELTIAHEVAHQFWSQIVGDDCVDWGFLDEMLASWSHAYYGEVYYNDWEYFQVSPYIDFVRTFYAEWGIGSIINQSNYDRPDLTGYVDYTQGPVIVEKLRQTLGHDQFILAIKDFFENQYFRIATLNDLQASCEEIYGDDLDWFFMPWFANGYLPDYAIELAVYDSSTSFLTFQIVDHNEDRNQYTYSQQIPLMIYDSQDNELVNTMVWVNGTTSFEFELTNAPDLIMLDYHDFILVQLPDSLTKSYSISGEQVYSPLPFGLDVIFTGGVFLASGILMVIIILIEKRK
jgi:hypothetical protein